jgi:hypothetical protein
MQHALDETRLLLDFVIGFRWYILPCLSPFLFCVGCLSYSKSFFQSGFRTSAAGYINVHNMNLDFHIVSKYCQVFP